MTMKVYIFDERSPKIGRNFDNLGEMRDYCANLNANGRDWGKWDEEPVEDATPSDLAEVLYGSWGRVAHKGDVAYFN